MSKPEFRCSVRSYPKPDDERRFYVAVNAECPGYSSVEFGYVEIRRCADASEWEVQVMGVPPLKFCGTREAAIRRACFLFLEVLNKAVDAVADHLAKDGVVL